MDVLAARSVACCTVRRVRRGPGEGAFKGGTGRGRRGVSAEAVENTNDGGYIRPGVIDRSGDVAPGHGELLSQLRGLIEEAEAAMADVDIGWADARRLPVDDAGEMLAAPQQVARMEVRMDKAPTFRQRAVEDFDRRSQTRRSSAHPGG